MRPRSRTRLTPAPSDTTPIPTAVITPCDPSTTKGATAATARLKRKRNHRTGREESRAFMTGLP